jgi:hypothetical protein
VKPTDATSGTTSERYPLDSHRARRFVLCRLV